MRERAWLQKNSKQQVSVGTMVPDIEVVSLCLKPVLFRTPDKVNKGKMI